METKELKELKAEIKKMSKKIDTLEQKLSKHIVFIEQVYAPLQKSIDKFKRFFR
jgi:predicted  nucleic acid-binding Zn-ribbon protein|tara:strand:+ start:196 stop:357 length:162 start_codon:yes stop_codon:yes gene_type:complete